MVFATPTILGIAVTLSPYIETRQPIENGVRVGLGVRCRVYGGGLSESLMYRVNDLGKTGVPQLSPKQVAELRKIRQYVKGPALWFTQKPEFIVFIAGRDSPICGDGDSKLILNGGCNEVFSPTSETDVFPEVDCDETPARPWVPDDVTDYHLKPNPSYWKHAADH